MYMYIYIFFKVRPKLASIDKCAGLLLVDKTSPLLIFILVEGYLVDYGIGGRPSQ